MDHIAQLDLHCRHLLSRLYRDGALSKRNLRDEGPGGSGFHPRTLKNHLLHLEDQRLVRIEHVKSSDLCSLTNTGERVAAMVIANEIGIPVGTTKEKLDLLFGEANSNHPTVDDFAVNIALPSYFLAHESGALTEQIKFHRRRRLRELEWYGKAPSLSGTKIRSVIENLGNLSSTSVQVASPDLGTYQDTGWQTISRGTAKLPPPVADPGLNPNDWQQIARRRLELESTFEEVPIVLPQWFDQ